MAEMMFPKPHFVSPSVGYRDSHVHKRRNKKCLFGRTQIIAGREGKTIAPFHHEKAGKSNPFPRAELHRSLAVESGLKLHINQAFIHPVHL